MQRKQSDALIVHCSDPRFQSAHRDLIDLNCNYYDLLAFPGASKAIAENQLVVDNIVLLHSLHGFETIHIFDHVHCGAFGDVTDEDGAHKAMIKEAEAALNKTLPKVTVIGHLVGQKAAVKL